MRPLEAIGVMPGSVLTFTKDTEITCIVTDNNRVILDEETYSISGAARVILRGHYHATRKQARQDVISGVANFGTCIIR